MNRRARSASHGFSVVELSIALVIVAVALAIAARLLLEAERRSAVELSRILETPVEIAAGQLRADAAAAASGAGDAARGEVLSLVRPSGVTVSYELEGRDLVRRVSDPAGRRPVLSDVRRFSWTWLGGGKLLLLVELEYERTRLPGPVAAPRGVERQALAVTLRGGGGRGW